jgi:hypothetical protein
VSRKRGLLVTVPRWDNSRHDCFSSVQVYSLDGPRGGSACAEQSGSPFWCRVLAVQMMHSRQNSLTQASRAQPILE